MMGTGQGLRAGSGEVKGQTMMTVLEKLTTAVRDRARYRRTRDEIARMPIEIALDVGIYPGDAKAIARRTVYGR